MKISFLGFLLLAACAPKMASVTLSPKAAIIGGRSVTPQEAIATTTVQVFKLSEDEATISSCTGNLIGEHVILTAAHCVAENGERNWVYFGREVPGNFFDFLLHPRGEAPSSLREVLKTSVHPAWSSHYQKSVRDWYDLGLLRYVGEMPSGYLPLRLHPWRIEDGQILRIAGFGLIDGINKIPAKDLQQTDVSVLNENWSATEMLLDTSRGHASCHGDSGGPAFVMTPEGEEILVGIDSRSELKSDPEFECSGNTIYTRIEPALSWILGEISSLN